MDPDRSTSDGSRCCCCCTRCFGFDCRIVQIGVSCRWRGNGGWGETRIAKFNCLIYKSVQNNLFSVCGKIAETLVQIIGPGRESRTAQVKGYCGKVTVICNHASGGTRCTCILGPKRSPFAKHDSWKKKNWIVRRPDATRRKSRASKIMCKRKEGWKQVLKCIPWGVVKKI
jgi:hypothetical protein